MSINPTGLIETACKKCDAPLETILEKQRGRSEIVDDRRRVARYIYETTDLPVMQIGRLLGQKNARLGLGIFRF